MFPECPTTAVFRKTLVYKPILMIELHPTNVLVSSKQSGLPDPSGPLPASISSATIKEALTIVSIESGERLRFDMPTACAWTAEWAWSVVLH